MSIKESLIAVINKQYQFDCSCKYVLRLYSELQGISVLYGTAGTDGLSYQWQRNHQQRNHQVSSSLEL